MVRLARRTKARGLIKQNEVRKRLDRPSEVRLDKFRLGKDRQRSTKRGLAILDKAKKG